MEMSLKERVEAIENISVNDFDILVSDIKQGVLFFYCTWAYVETQFKHILKIQHQYPKIKLFLFDIDEEEFKVFRENNNLISHGYGETFWVIDGKIIGKTLKYNSANDLIEAEKFSIALASMID